MGNCILILEVMSYKLLRVYLIRYGSTNTRPTTDKEDNMKKRFVTFFSPF